MLHAVHIDHTLQNYFETTTLKPWHFVLPPVLTLNLKWFKFFSLFGSQCDCSVTFLRSWWKKSCHLSCVVWVLDINVSFWEGFTKPHRFFLTSCLPFHLFCAIVTISLSKFLMIGRLIRTIGQINDSKHPSRKKSPWLVFCLFHSLPAQPVSLLLQYIQWIMQEVSTGSCARHSFCFFHRVLQEHRHVTDKVCVCVWEGGWTTH